MPYYFLSLALLLMQLAPGLTLPAAQAQGTQTAKGLAVGEPVPDVRIDRIIHYPTTSASISDFKGKLLILDFWATWCGPCIGSLNKLDSLQQAFKEELIVLPVTDEPASKVAPFMKKRGWRLPSATSNTTLKVLFPHQGLPHQVWIWNGKVEAITSHHYATAENIRRVLSGEQVTFRGKQEVAVDRSRPLFIDGNGGSGENLLYQSALSTRIQVDAGGVSRQGGNRIAALNVTLPYLYFEAFSDQIPFAGRSNRVRLEVPDSLRRQLTGQGLPQQLTGNYQVDQAYYNWADKNTFCYSLVLPRPLPKPALNAIMRSDLNRFFRLHAGIEGSMQRRKVNCLVLVRTGSKDLLRTQGGDPTRSADGQRLQLRNKPFHMLVNYIAAGNHNQPAPVLDETGYSGNIDINLTLPLDNLPRLRRELRRYGLSLQEQERELDMLVISKAGSKTGSNMSP